MVIVRHRRNASMDHYAFFLLMHWTVSQTDAWDRTTMQHITPMTGNTQQEVRYYSDKRFEPKIRMNCE